MKLSSFFTLFLLSSLALANVACASSIRGIKSPRRMEASSHQEKRILKKGMDNTNSNVPYQTVAPMSPADVQVIQVTNQNNGQVTDRNSPESLENKPIVPLPVGKRDIVVAVQYYEDSEHVSWNLFDERTSRVILFSDYGSVTDSEISLDTAEGVTTGRYKLVMTNMYGRGISSGTGWVKILDITSFSEEEQNDASKILEEGKVIFSHNGRFGPMLMEEFDLY